MVNRFISLLLATLLTWSIVTVHAQEEVQTAIFLEKVPERAYAGDSIIFSGRLVRSDNGKGIAKAPITLKNENIAVGGNTIITGLTDDSGRFSIEWVPKSKDDDTFILYANYMGSALYSNSQSEKYSIKVERIHLVVNTNKEKYNYGDDLIIFGKGRPNDELSVFLTNNIKSVLLSTMITVDEMGNFNSTLMKWERDEYEEWNDSYYSDWDNPYYSGAYLIYVRSTIDRHTYERVIIQFEKQIIPLPISTQTILTLEPLPANATYNDNQLFTGQLTTATGLPIMDATILIKHRNETKDKVIARGITSDGGIFIIYWKALQVDSDILSLHGGFEGGNGFLPSTSEEFNITFKPRTLTMELNKVKFGPNDPLIVSGIGPKERLNIKLIDPEGNPAVTDSILVPPNEGYEKTLMHWTRSSYLFPEGQYSVTVETENSPVLTASMPLYFEEPKPLSQYKIAGTIFYKDQDGTRHALEGAKVTMTSPYGEIESYTDRFGYYTFKDLHSIVENLGKTYSLEVELDGKYFKLIDATISQVVSKRSGPIKFDGSLQDISLEPIFFSDKSEAAAARIFALQNDVVRFYTDVLGLQPKKIDIEIFSEKTPKGKYGYETDRKIPKIWIGKGTSSPRNPYTWDTLTHEYTHYMQGQYASVDHYYDMNHGGFSNPTTADSMVEGFANFMSAIISQHYAKEQAGKFLKYDLEHNFKVDSVKFLSEELAAAGIFWDIYDEGMNGEDGDKISLPIEDIWKIMIAEYQFPSYHEDSGFDAMKRNVYYLKDLHYILTKGEYTMKLDEGVVEELFRSHGLFDGFTDPERPGRI